jgi:hypothetical protein
MQIRTALLATLLALAYGCATEPEQTQAGAAAPAPSHSKGPVYRTGSRLPPVDDDSGPSTVSGASKDDYINDRNATISPTRGN